MNFEKITIIFEIISALFIFISYLFEILQSFINYNFKEYRTKEDIVEKIFYEQFSYDIYENINSYLYTKLNYVNNNLDNDDMKIDINLDSYYDCQGIYDDELNEKICQNKIVNNYTCCRAECCSRTNDNTIFCKNYLINSNNIPNNYHSLYYNDEEILEDPRRKFCTYFNKYSHYIYQSNLTNIRLYQYKYNYKDILLNKSSYLRISKNKIDNYYDCGIIDTRDNHLYSTNRYFCPIYGIVINNNIFDLEDINDLYYDNNHYIDKDDLDTYLLFYNNQNSIKLNYILSEFQPKAYEWKNIINSKTKDKLSKININEKDKILKKLYIWYFYEGNGPFISVNELRDYISFDNQLINTQQKLNFYSTKYIGFENSQQFENFTKIFPQYDYKNSPLYKFANEIFPSIESIIIGFILIFLSLIYIIIFFLSLFNKFEYLRNKTLTIFFIIKQIIFTSTFAEELGLYLGMTGKFEEIVNIGLDNHYYNYYRQILNLYNERRFQLLFLLSIIFLSISEMITIIGLIFSKNINKNKNNINLSDNNENYNSAIRIMENNHNNNNRQNYKNNNSNDILRSSENRLLDTLRDNEINNEDKSKTMNLKENQK